MGNCNCIDFSRAVSWVDDGEWDFSDPEEEEEEEKQTTKDTNRKQEEESKPSKETEAATMAPTEVKIKISKKQLEKLLEQVDSKDLPMQDLLVGLAKIGQPCQVVPDKDRYWRPALQSIPEVVEQ